MIERRVVYKNSDLPYSFGYKIRAAYIGKRCPVCGNVMGYGEFGTRLNLPSIQHNIPISKGGEHKLDNISVICSSCNKSIRNNITGELNSKEVKEIWQKLNG